MKKYEINVAVGGKHYCKIYLPSVTEDDANKKFDDLVLIFKAAKSDDPIELSMTVSQETKQGCSSVII